MLGSIKRHAVRLALIACASIVVSIATLTPVFGWWSGGHRMCTLAALRMLPAEMPAFFRAAGPELSELSVEPDNWKSPTAPHLKSTEHFEHFIDLELLNGKPLPETRSDLLRLYIDNKAGLGKGGFLPYSILEGYERLMLAFRDYRNRPDAPGMQQKVLVYASWVAHYCQDAAMPLHTTINYDGKPGADGAVVQKGIHARIDAYPEKNGLTPEMLSEGQEAAEAAIAWPVILKVIQSSHEQVDKCYELDAAGGFDKEPAKGKELMLERTRVAAKLTADIWYSAWKNSAPEKATIR